MDEQKRLDREWYNADEGYDETHNPFADTSDEYAQKKEKELEVRANYFLPDSIGFIALL
jgi:hypothetical protein